MMKLSINDQFNDQLHQLRGYIDRNIGDRLYEASDQLRIQLYLLRAQLWVHLDRKVKR
jgi:hypothetical protein